MPKVQETLQSYMKTSELGVHLNGDEAMCFGAAFIASNTSAQFKVRKVYLTQHPKYQYSMAISAFNKTTEETPKTADDDDENSVKYERESVVYKRSDYLG